MVFLRTVYIYLQQWKLNDVSELTILLNADGEEIRIAELTPALETQQKKNS
jgi:hypothetical protein